MKMLALLIALSGFAHAAEVTVECKMNTETYPNQFAMTGKFDNTTGTFENMNFEVDLRVAGHARETRTLDIVRDGSITAFPAGRFTLKPFFIVNSVIKGDDVEYINLAVDYPGFFTSQIRMLDGMTFFSTCRTK